MVIPSYNGARKMANLTALLALLLAREGVPVLFKPVNAATLLGVLAELIPQAETETAH